MHINEIHLQSRNERFAIIRRTRGAYGIEAEFILRDGSFTLRAETDDKAELWAFARKVQQTLEERNGCGAEALPLYLALESMSDI
jgi:hypothetical protein